MRPGLVLILVLCTACQKLHEEQAVSPPVQEVHVDEIPEDIRVPVKMWEAIEAIPSDALIPQEVADNDLLTNRGTTLFSPLTVILKEHNPQVLDQPEIKIFLPSGGGQIDLATYLGREPGSFYVKFEWPEWTEVKEIYSFYVSRARKRKLDGVVYGVGCNKFVDISTKVNKNNESGIKVNTTRERHTTVLGGHFVFSAKKDNQTFLTQVTFVDSDNKNLFCDGVKTL